MSFMPIQNSMYNNIDIFVYIRRLEHLFWEFIEVTYMLLVFIESADL